jgi:hypothetical protein
MTEIQNLKPIEGTWRFMIDGTFYCHAGESLNPVISIASVLRLSPE